MQVIKGRIMYATDFDTLKQGNYLVVNDEGKVFRCF